MKMPQKITLILLILTFIFANYSLSKEFLPVYNFKVDNKTYLFSIYKANPEEIVLIYDYNPKDEYLDEARAKITGRKIEFNFLEDITIKGILNENKTNIKLTNFINKKKKTNQKISTPWIKLDEFATHTETFKINDKEYKISFPIYKDQLKIVKKYDDYMKKFDLILVTNDKMNVDWNKVDFSFSIKKYDEDKIFKETLGYIEDMSRVYQLNNRFKKSEINNHPIKILFKNPKYGDLVLSFLDPIAGRCMLSLYKDNQYINYGCIEVIVLEPSTNTKPSSILTEKILKEIINQLEKDKINYNEIADIYKTIQLILFKNSNLKNIDEASKSYKEIKLTDKEIYSTKGKEKIRPEDKLNQLIYEYISSNEPSEIDPYQQKIKNKNYTQLIKIGLLDAGHGSKELNFLFEDFIVSLNESFTPLAALFPYETKKHPLQVKLRKNTYSMSPIYNKFKDLFYLIIKHFQVQNKDGNLLPQLKINNFFYQEIYLEKPPVDMEYIKKKLEERGYSTDFENTG